MGVMALKNSHTSLSYSTDFLCKLAHRHRKYSTDRARLIRTRLIRSST